MPPRSALDQRLEQLQAELAASTTLSSGERARLQALLGDLRDHASGGESSHSTQSLSERLQDATEQLEDSHPNLTFAIGAVAEALSRLGI
jgi:Domain of unknown function (DUF4404)